MLKGNHPESSPEPFSPRVQSGGTNERCSSAASFPRCLLRSSGHGCLRGAGGRIWDPSAIHGSTRPTKTHSEQLLLESSHILLILQQDSTKQSPLLHGSGVPKPPGILAEPKAAEEGQEQEAEDISAGHGTAGADACLRLAAGSLAALPQSR